MPEFEIKKAYRWADWPDRDARGFTAKDIGTDLVAVLRDGSLVAIQCKCYKESDTIQRKEIDKFLSLSGAFDMRWVVATCGWGGNAEEAIKLATPPVRRIDFHEYDGELVSNGRFAREPRVLKEPQAEAVENVVRGLIEDDEADRGQLIMACGTGKTYVSLLIAERMAASAPEGERGVVEQPRRHTASNVLFLCPSIALVSQARREWLSHAALPINALVVCSDGTSGGRGESDDIMTHELECAVTTDPEEITAHVTSSGKTGINCVFCTYQSLDKVQAAQRDHGAPEFDLLIADEAHRTTGVVREKATGFQACHDNSRVRARKRLYMTATQRIYEEKSRKALKTRGYESFDMQDASRYGHVLYRLTFKDAVEGPNPMLSDYKAIVMVVRKNKIIEDIFGKYRALYTDDGDLRALKYDDIERLVGTAFAINGIRKGPKPDDRMAKVLGFANSRRRSKIFTRLLGLDELRDVIRSRRGDADTLLHETEHVDGNTSALGRNRALRELDAATEDRPRMVMNVRLFTEGVDVPSLSAVAFLDPRDSVVDIVQAVGRVMRAAAGKRRGYIIIPVPLDLDRDFTSELEDRDKWETTGRVLRALQAHDRRLPKDPMRFIELVDAGVETMGTSDSDVPSIAGFQDVLKFGEYTEALYTKVVKSSGLRKPGESTADDIQWFVEKAGHVLEKCGLAAEMSKAAGLGVNTELDKPAAAHACKTAALLLMNACLLHRRLEGDIGGLPRLRGAVGHTDPIEFLSDSWEFITRRDYAPVFGPALAVLDALPDTRDARLMMSDLADAANEAADDLNELGYDHAGPLYHRILGTATSDSANYTDNVSALMLARLALSNNFVDWSDDKSVRLLRIMDPACGTGTLLMAALKTVKERVEDAGGQTDGLHRVLVEDSIYGLDINRHAAQLAACNLTLGAPDVNYKRMNLHTMKHGPQPDGSVAAGSVEMLRVESGRNAMRALVQPVTTDDLGAKQVDSGTDNEIPSSGLDLVIMNPPFGSKETRSHKYSGPIVKQMREYELEIQAQLRMQDKVAGNVLNINSISTFFTPLADRLLDPKRGTLAKILPVTACTTTSGLNERKFLASRFHVVRIVTSHDPKHPNFSYKTGIHECLMICRRHNGGGPKPPTEFVSLHRMPKNAREAVEVADTIASASPGDWGSVTSWPAERVAAGDWSPVQWADIELFKIVQNIETSEFLESLGERHEVGPGGEQLRGGTYVPCDDKTDSAVRLFWSISSKLRRTINGSPEELRSMANKRAAKLWEKRSKLLIAAKINTVSGRLTALYSESPSLGNGWVPIKITDEDEGKALAVWLNSTPARLTMLNRRTKMLTYPNWSLPHLRGVRIPKPDSPAWDALRKAYDQTCDTELLPMRDEVNDKARSIIDGAAAAVLGVDARTVANWRKMLAREPTISNEYADQS